MHQADRVCKCFLFVFLWLAAAGVVGVAVAKEYGDVQMQTTRQSMEKAGVKAVLFPHWFHRIRYKCKVCHESLFVMQKGATDVTMRRIMEGETCGACHNGQIAWEPLYCDRCHNSEFEPAASAPATPPGPAPAAASTTPGAVVAPAAPANPR